MKGALDSTAARLVPFSDTPRLDAQVLMARALHQPRTWILAHTESSFGPGPAGALEKMILRLEKGEPLPYVIGSWEFFGLEFDLSPEVLIPRPETELLVEKAIARLQRSQIRKTAADIGTGSGCIAVSMAVHVPDLQVTGTDISSAALGIARRNARKFHVERQIEFLHCDLLPPVRNGSPAFDLICANLPYIPSETLHNLPVYEREPALALDGGRDGLDLIRRLLSRVPEWLAPHGLLLLEIEATQGNQAVSLACDIFTEAEIHLHPDLTGRDRLLEVAL